MNNVFVLSVGLGYQIILMVAGFSTYTHDLYLRPPRGVCEAHLLQAYKPCVIGAIPTKTANLRRPPAHIPLGL